MDRGKHDAPARMNEALELHYKEQIAILEEKIASLELELNEAKHENLTLRQDIDMLKEFNESLGKAFIEQAVSAVGKKN